MIIRLCEDTPKLHLRVVTPGCDARQLLSAENVWIEIYKPHHHHHHAHDDHLLNHRDLRPNHHRHNPHQPPSIRYPAFEMDDDGLVVFYFDDALWRLPAGRYYARLLLGDNVPEKHFEIDLCNRRAMVDMAVTGSVNCEVSECL